MAVLSTGDSAPYADHLRPNLHGCRRSMEMPFGFQNHTPALWRLWCHRTARSAKFSGTTDRGTTMEMHQVRYFLAVARVLNFTRAADECNVTQPSLTRAIKQLEAELGGDLFRRERPAAQLTELGQRMHPLLKQCYEAATGARELASSFKSGEVGALRIALTHSVDLSLLIPHLDQIKRQFNRLEFRFLRGNADEVARISEEGRSRTRHCRRNRRGLGPARHLAAVHRKLSARRQQAASAGGPRQNRFRRPSRRAIAVAKLLRALRRG